MSKYENAMKLMEERCGNGKEEVIALATISLSPSAAGNFRAFSLYKYSVFE